MSRVTIPLYPDTADTSTQLADLTPNLIGGQLSYNTHGVEAITLRTRLRNAQAQAIYDAGGVPHVPVTAEGGLIASGRLEDIALRDSGADLTALGYWRALSDVPYTALWSTTDLSQWKAVVVEQRGSRNAQLYQFDTNNRLFIGLTKNTTYPNSGANVGSLMLAIPYGSSRQIQAAQFDLVMNLPANYAWQADGFDVAIDNTLGNATTHVSVTSAGATITRSYLLFLNSVPRDALVFDLVPPTGAPTTYVGENGASYVRMTNVRVTTSVTNVINTTLSANVTAGSGVTATVGSTTRMYVGQRLTINSTGTNSESVIVSSITSGTQFVATFASNHTAGETVRGIVIYADEILRDMRATISATNSAQLFAADTLIQSPGLDLTDVGYEDASMATSADALALLGDTSNNRWEVGVTNQRFLYFRQKGSAAQTWLVDVAENEIERTLATLANSVYAVYQDASGRTLRTASSVNSASVATYALTRRQAVDAETTSGATAGTIAATALADTATPLPRGSIRIQAVYSLTSGRVQPWEVRPGDTLILRNLPQTYATDVDRIRSFRISRTVVDLVSGALTVEPEQPTPQLSVLLARADAKVR